MLTKDDIQHIAALARIRFSEEELETFQKEFGAILDFVGKLKEIDTHGVEPTTQVTGLENAFRDDGANLESRIQNQELLLSQAPKRERNYVKVKAVFE